MKTPKVAIITQAVKLADEKAGLNRTSYIAELLAKEGFEVDLLTSTFQHWEKQRRDIVDPKYYELPYEVIFLEEPGYKHNVSPMRIHSENVFARNLDEYLERFGKDYDLIWCQIPPNNIAATAALFAKAQGIPFVVDINDLWPEAMKMVVNIPIVSDFIFSDFVREAEIAYANATAAVGTSHEYANRCMQDIPHLTVYVGGDIARFDAGVEKHCSSIEKAPGEFWVTYAGSLARSYDLPTLIEACALAAPLVKESTGKRLRLFILGDGPRRPELEAIANTLEDASVTFTGYVDYQVMAAYLSTSDVLVNSLIKTAPQSIVSKIADYLSAGRPILNTGMSKELQGMCEELDFGVNVEPENTPALAGALLALAQDDAGCKRMGENGRKLAEDQFDRPRSYRPIVELVKELVE